jgi:hypothetical protein
MENIHIHSLEDEIARWPCPPCPHLQKGSTPHASHICPKAPAFLGWWADFGGVEPLNKALKPSPINKEIFNRIILPSTLRPSTNTPASIPAVFPPFPPKYTYKFTPLYPPRITDPEKIHKRSVQERNRVEASLAKLAQAETPVVQEVIVAATGDNDDVVVGREGREAFWWRTWKEMECDKEIGAEEVWPVPKVRRGVGGLVEKSLGGRLYIGTIAWGFLKM